MASVLEKIKQFNAGRLPDMLQRKYALMQQNPFSFFRATSHLFYEDLIQDFHAVDSTKVWSCADLHIQNFGAYKADNRQVYFDLNDFDDAALLPATFDLVRMSVSIRLVSEIQKWDNQTADKLVHTFLDAYQQTLEKGKSKDIDHRIAQGELRNLIRKLEKRDNFKFVQSYLHKDGKHLRADNKKILPVEENQYDAVKEYVSSYFSKHQSTIFKRVRDIKFRVAGTSSLGLERYLILIETAKNVEEDFLLLDLKAARPSALLPFLTIPQPMWQNEGDRIVSIQDRVNDVLPAFFNAITFKKKAFVMREIQDEGDKVDVLSMLKAEKFKTILNEMGVITASGHLRSSGRNGSSITDELIDFALQKDWKEQVTVYSKKYMLKIQADFNAFAKAFKKEHTPQYR